MNDSEKIILTLPVEMAFPLAFFRLAICRPAPFYKFRALDKFYEV